MGQHRRGQGLDVVGQHVVAAGQRGRGAGGPQELQTCARGGAQPQVGGAAGGLHQGDDVAAHRLGDEQLTDGLDEVADHGGVGHRRQPDERVGGGPVVEHRQFRLAARVAHGHPGGEAVALGLGEGIGALHLERVLGRHHQERAGQLVADPVDGDLPLLHASSSADWVFGRGPVDLVGDHDVGEHRSRLELELPGLLVKIATPVTSLGSRSGVNWIRRTLASIDAARALASVVFPTPGTSSISR